MQKGTAVEGALVTDEVLESSEHILKKGRGGNLKGAQQFYSPPELAELVTAVIGTRLPVLDPTAGDGSLLKGFSPANSFGVEIDKDQIANSEGSYNAIQGDINAIFPLLYRVCPSFNAIVANPPFGLMDWEGEDQRGSVRVTLAYINKMLTEDGQFVLVCGRDQFRRELAGTKNAEGIYFAVDCNDLFDGTDHPAVICFGVHPELRAEAYDGAVEKDTRGQYAEMAVPKSMLTLLAEKVREHRKTAIGTYGEVASYTYGGGYKYVEAFEAIQKEHNRRRRFAEGKKVAQEYDIVLSANAVSVVLTPYAKLALSKVSLLHRIERLHRKPINWFASYERDWAVVEEALELGCCTIAPDVHERVLNVIHEARKIACPNYPLKRTQRLAFLNDINHVLCEKSDEARGFIAGNHYEITTDTVEEKIPSEKWVQIQKGENAGEWKKQTLLERRKMLRIQIKNDQGRWQTFHDARKYQKDIEFLTMHFEIPDPGDIGTKYPLETDRMRQVILELQREVVQHSAAFHATNPNKKPVKKLLWFQIEDLSRLLVKGSGLLAWHQGLGKTIGGALWAKVNIRLGRARERVLIVCPQDLIQQWKDELERILGIKIEIIKTHGDAVRVRNHFKNGGEGWYITYYEALSTNGIRGKTKLKPVEILDTKEERVRVPGTGRYGYCVLAHRQESSDEWRAVSREQYDVWRALPWHERNDHTPKYEWIPVESKHMAWVRPLDGGEPVRKYTRSNPIFNTKIKTITSRDYCPECRSDRKHGWNGMNCTATMDNGEQCGYTHYLHRVKPMGSLLSVTFKNGCLIIDEGTMIQGDYSKRSEVIRGINARWILLMTGTPIKNYIAQAFWPLWKCLGDKSKRFPFGYKDKSDFEDKHAVIQWTLVGGKLTNRKALPEITNISEFWRLFSTAGIRRRKEDSGVPMVPHRIHKVSTPLGTGQLNQMDQWTQHFWKFFMEIHPESDVTKAGADVVKQMVPLLGLAQKLEYAAVCPASDPDVEWLAMEEEPSNWTPANLRTLLVTMALVKQGRRVVVGSQLIAEAQWLHEQLLDKGVKSTCFIDEDGTTTVPAKRAKLVKEFQEGNAEVLVTTVMSLRLGHNIDAASACVIHGLPWSHDDWDQFINRTHRFTSQKPVDTYVILDGPPPEDDKTEGTMTRRKWNLLQKKGDSTALAIDGRLIEEDGDDITPEEVMKQLVEQGVERVGNEVDEADIERVWANTPDIGNFLFDATILEGDKEETPWLDPHPWTVQTTVLGDHTKPQLALTMVAGNGLAEPELFDAEYPDSLDGHIPDEPVGAHFLYIAPEEPIFELQFAGGMQEEPQEEEADVTMFPPPPLAPDQTDSFPAPPPEEPPPSDPTSVTAALKELAELHTLGILTDEEFAEGKAGLIAQLKRAA